MNKADDNNGSYSSYFDDPNVRFPAYPYILEDLDVFKIPEGLGFRIHGGKVPVVFRGRDIEETFEHVLLALNGRTAYKDIVSQCPDSIDVNTLSKTLMLLHSKGLLGDGSKRQQTYVSEDSVLNRQLLYWGRNLGLTGYMESSPDVQSQISRYRLLIVGTALFGSSVYDVLSRVGFNNISLISWDDDAGIFECLNNGEKAPRHRITLNTTCMENAASKIRSVLSGVDLVVTATRNSPMELYRTINRVCLEERVPFIFANDNGGEFEIGPYVVPYRTACYTCLEMRRSSVSESALDTYMYHEHLAKTRESGNTTPKGESISAALLAASLLSLEVTRIATAIAAPTLANATMNASPLTGEISQNKILRVPLCPDCYPGRK